MLRDPANETLPADSLGVAGCEALIAAGALAGSVIAGSTADHLGWYAS